ncbi:DNA ligase [Saccharobesus litoralis]|uniref:DNA ligase n=1 Tax=Saccharobesus litoralis TaxID=2172099 RepID=A0A2S0VWR2_9ALTE|nr:DNA ligase [Saccharobesus litoralis]AWB68625.1 DNA ligase [Saccharobesus litoralis]
MHKQRIDLALSKFFISVSFVVFVTYVSALESQQLTPQQLIPQQEILEQFTPRQQTPPQVTLAKVYSAEIDISQYWVSEKYDGVRGIWTGQELLTRSGNVIHAPTWFTEKLPSTPLDGELWAGYQKFDLTSSIIRSKQVNDQTWRNIQYKVFDLYQDPRPFHQRYMVLTHLVTQINQPYIQLVEQNQFLDERTLYQELDRVIANQGEGLMLRHVESGYQAGRNASLLKLKKYQDAEATIIEHIAGKGRYKGILGAVLVQDSSGRQFKIGTGFSLAQRQAPPPIGTKITYKYLGLTKTGLPRFPVYLRVRKSV